MKYSIRTSEEYRDEASVMNHELCMVGFLIVNQIHCDHHHPEAARQNSSNEQKRFPKRVIPFCNNYCNPPVHILGPTPGPLHPLHLNTLVHG